MGTEVTPGWPPRGGPWEYHLHVTNSDGAAIGQKLDQALDALGRDGWELVTVEQLTPGLTWIFKRPKK